MLVGGLQNNITGAFKVIFSVYILGDTIKCIERHGQKVKKCYRIFTMKTFWAFNFISLNGINT
jgi:hypothetical protein